MKPSNLTNRPSNTRPESGQTIALVAVAMMGILIIAALAIDLTTLYVAHGEIQRAADSAALAGAKGFVDSGVTTYPSNASLQTVAQTLAVNYATAVANQNNVAGAPASFVVAPQINLAVPGNPTITVSLQRTGLPLFFARIWGNSVASVSATAIAEAYNSAYGQANFLPPAPKCVKPFLVPNIDQNQLVPFIDPATWSVHAAPSPFIGETISLTADCGALQGVCSPSGPPWAGKYLPMLLPDNHRYCPAGGAQYCSPIAGRFQGSTQCCDGAIFNYSQCGVPGLAGTVPTGAWDQNPNSAVGGTNGQAQNGLQCLIHTNTTGPPPLGSNPQQDTLNISQANTGPLQINPGDFTQRRYGVAQGSVTGTSDSIITVPLFDTSVWPPPNPPQVNIVGFLQLFVNYVGPTLSPPAIAAPNGDMNATILNVIGCGTSLPANSAISGGGASAIPVRLIHN